MAIKSFTPCSDWFFVFTDPQGGESSLRIAGWAISEDKDGLDVVFGMVAAKGLAKLIPVPPVNGTYTHESELPVKRPIDL